MYMGNLSTDYQQIRSYVDVQALVKADKSDPNVIFIEASNQLADTQRDVVLQKALKDESASFLRKGVISWNHLHKIENDPSYIIGEPQDVQFSDDGRTLVKARMYPKNKYARDILEKASDGSTRLGASIGGFILRRQKELNKSFIVKVMWDEVAITHQPVNEATIGRVSVVPFDDFFKSFIQNDGERAEELVKALAAGYGTDAATMTGGRALQPESMMGAESAKAPDQGQGYMTQAFQTVLKNLKMGKVHNFGDVERVLCEVNLRSYAVPVARHIALNITQVKNYLSKEEGV